jgi:hypothetical protein
MLAYSGLVLGDVADFGVLNCLVTREAAILESSPPETVTKIPS